MSNTRHAKCHLIGLFLLFSSLQQVQADGFYDGNNRPSDRHPGGPGQIAYVRCPVRKSEVFARNETGVLVPVNKRKGLRGNATEEHFHPCWCTEYYHRPVEFCPANLQVCVVNGRDGPVECLSHSGRASVAQVFWPAGFFYICIVLFVFCATRRCTYVWQYVQRKSVWCVCFEAATTELDLLVRASDRILAQEGRPRLLGDGFVRRERQRLQLELQPQTTNKRQKIKKPYSLKTKRFIASNNVDDDEPECAICLAALEYGENIGDIPCGHLFHKECLKTWLKRRKRCPLCQDKGLLSSCDDDDKVTEAPSSNLTMRMSSTVSETTSDDNGEESRPLDTDEPSNLDELLVNENG